LRVLTSSAADNKALRTRVPEQVLGGNYNSGFTAKLALKDQRIANEMATRLGVPLFTLAQTKQLLTLAVAMGRGEQSVLAVAAVLEDITGVRLSPRA
jgi:3-hydroxyisobutyrate dehydrogenase-like beta-hydroxyacid dehydrogenase